MVFAHGFGCDQNVWRLVAPEFADAYEIVLFDHVGNGKSDLSAYDGDWYSTLDGYAADVLEIIHDYDLRTPALILQCGDDVIAPSVVADYVYKHASGSTLVSMNATGHCPNLSAPEETVAAIKAYL